MFIHIVLSLLACSAAPPTRHNQAPEISILSPAPGAIIAADTPLVMQIRASDDQTATDELSFQWSSDLQDRLGGQLEQMEPDLYVHLVQGLEEGEHTLLLEVSDAHGEVAVDTVVVDVRANEAPVVEILHPAHLSPLPSDGLTLVASVDDDFDLTEDLLVVVSSDVDGNLDHAVQVLGETLEVTLQDALSESDHELTLKVFDSGGKTDSDTITLEADINAAPVITLLTPEDGIVYGDTPYIQVELQVSDDMNDLSALELDWFGLIDEAPCKACTWPTTPLSDGTHSFYLDLSHCSDQNRTLYYSLGLTVRDPEGLTDTVEHLIGLSCDP